MLFALRSRFHFGVYDPEAYLLNGSMRINLGYIIVELTTHVHLSLRSLVIILGRC